MAELGGLRDFLTSRRRAINPWTAGLPTSPVPRRHPGLRREEVAVLAGISADYYTRLEQGRVGNVSAQVLDAVARALNLDDTERDYLHRLVTTEPSRARRTTAGSQPKTPRRRVRPALAELVRLMDPVPAILQGPRMEVLAVNRIGAALTADFDAMPLRERNIARWLFLDPLARHVYPDWEAVAGGTVAALRRAWNPGTPDPALETLVGEPTVKSPEFARFWAEYRLFEHRYGRKRFHHDLVGDMTLNYETLDIAGDQGLFISTYAADPGSPSAERLGLLISWVLRQSGEDDDRRRADTPIGHDGTAAVS
jgi:transcriptional regulator with XRE-family HTH domain